MRGELETPEADRPLKGEGLIRMAYAEGTWSLTSGAQDWMAVGPGYVPLILSMFSCFLLHSMHSVVTGLASSLSSEISSSQSSQMP